MNSTASVKHIRRNRAVLAPVARTHLDAVSSVEILSSSRKHGWSTKWKVILEESCVRGLKMRWVCSCALLLLVLPVLESAVAVPARREPTVRARYQLNSILFSWKSWNHMHRLSGPFSTSLARTSACTSIKRFQTNYFIISIHAFLIIAY